MGVLMLNDINYSGGGGAEEMTLAQYEALSQAEKNDGKIRFITDVDGQGTWKLLGTKTGTTAINLPSAFNELLVTVSLGNTTVILTLSIPYLDLESSDRQYRGGYATTTTNLVYISVTASKTSINLGHVQNNGSDVTSASTIKVYYR